MMIDVMYEEKEFLKGKVALVTGATGGMINPFLKSLKIM